MLHLMAMEQPHSRIVGNKDKIGALARGHQICVSKHRTHLVAKLPRINPEMMPVEMHAMLPLRVVPDPQHRDLAKGQIGKRVVISADNPIEGPVFGIFLRKITKCQHLALELGRHQIARGPALAEGVLPECSGILGRKPVCKALTRLNRSLGQVRHAVHLIQIADAVPVHGCRHF